MWEKNFWGKKEKYGAIKKHTAHSYAGQLPCPQQSLVKLQEKKRDAWIHD
jgi:hypothetical protein